MRGRLHRERSWMLFRQVIAGKLAEAEQARIARHGVEAHAAPQLFKEDVVGVRHGLAPIHILAAANLKHRVAGVYVLFERGDCDGGLNGGARNVAVPESNLLIDDGEDAAGVGIDSDNSAVLAAKAIDSGGANNRVVKSGDIRESGVGESRDATKMRDTMQRSSRSSGRGRNRRCDRYSKDCGQENTSQLLHRFCSENFLARLGSVL